MRKWKYEMTYKSRISLLCILLVFLVGLSVSAEQSVRVSTSTGTGFIVSSEGYILTNEHVVHDATQVTITLGSQEYNAKIVKADPNKDLALLKISSSVNLPAVPLGNSDKTRISDSVVAMGCPNSICGTVTEGEVANLGVGPQGLIMTNLTIAQGSSGGPLFNQRGEIIGITTAWLMQEEKPTGFSLSIPINQAIPLLEEIPSFDPEQMGANTKPLEVQKIVERVSDSVAYMESKSMIPMTKLVPQEAFGQKCELLAKTKKILSVSGIYDLRYIEEGRPLFFGDADEQDTLLEKKMDIRTGPNEFLDDWVASFTTFGSPEFIVNFWAYDFPNITKAKEFLQLAPSTQILEDLWGTETFCTDITCNTVKTGLEVLKSERKDLNDLTVRYAIFVYYTAPFKRVINLQGLTIFRLGDLVFVNDLRFRESIPEDVNSPETFCYFIEGRVHCSWPQSSSSSLNSSSGINSTASSTGLIPAIEFEDDEDELPDLPPLKEWSSSINLSEFEKVLDSALEQALNVLSEL